MEKLVYEVNYYCIFLFSKMTEKQRDRKTKRQKNKETEKQRDRKTKRQKNKEIKKYT